MRLVWIPVAGTVAALVAVLLAHEPRDEDATVFEPPAETPVAQTHWVELREDGTFHDGEANRTYADAEELLDAIAPPGEPRPEVFLRRAGPEVTDDMLAEAVAALRGRCDVHGEEGQ